MAIGPSAAAEWQIQPERLFSSNPGTIEEEKEKNRSTAGGGGGGALDEHKEFH